VTWSLAGGVVGLGLASGLALVLSHVQARRRPDFAGRVLRHLADLPEFGGGRVPAAAPASRRVLAVLAAWIGEVLGGATSVRRRLERADLDLTVGEFRVQQAVWGLVGLCSFGALAVVVALRSPQRAVPMVVLTLVAAALGVLLRENRLTAQVRAHEREVLAELPALAELLALAVAAGEGPVAALDRVVGRSRGALSRELGRVLAAVRTGTPVAAAFDDYAARTGVPVVARFANGLAVAVERGTPLADVLHAQAADVREAQRRALIESGGRREIAMMVPVVFLVLPTTVMFAFWPGLVGLRLVTP
jgi:tight adherence protein C